MRSLATAVILCALLPLSQAACSISPPTLDDGIKQCFDDMTGSLRAIGSRWRTRDCRICSCGSNRHINCCDAYMSPPRSSEDCIVGFDRKACRYIVSKKNDCSIPCPNFSMVGK
ncbi:hypothetical protein DPEC_G00139110 [Dallia pectoralis]|uniref:Uncharacterized protein n=1 Tax=Dallia pectoralis TaxID=75939 RepID=A0ACC2GLU1_DALPE|nr:hypothetical protein DPEC_G00139110 [Dallia pectoralis]